MPTETVEVRTDDGVDLEAQLATPTGTSAGAGGLVVLAHPHPAYGGDMRAGAIDWFFHALPAAGLAALRFNFRGVGRSGGRHEGGLAERADVRAAVQAAARLGFGATAGAPTGRPLVLAGWSFGAEVALAVADEAVTGWFAIAPPLRILPADELLAGRDPRPVVLQVPEHDQGCPPACATAATAGWETTTVEVVPGTDHFLAGAAGLLTDRLVAWCRALAEGAY